jgi:hypothetical protein
LIGACGSVTRTWVDISSLFDNWELILSARHAGEGRHPGYEIGLIPVFTGMTDHRISESE